MAIYEINVPHIVGEVIDGEAIVMDLKTGNYYSSLGVGAAVWHFIGSGCAVEAIAATIEARFPEAAARVGADLSAFVEEMLGRNLIRPAIEQPAQQAPDARQLDSILHYARPEMQAYTDMQDLLLLDPVHEVDDAGWPEPRK
jgi:hypothetical protein